MRNKLAEFGHELDMNKWKLGLPDIKPAKDGGFSIIQRMPNGDMQGTVYKSNDLHEVLKQTEDAAKVVGPEIAQAMKYNALAKLPNAEQLMKVHILRDMVDNPGNARQVLGEKVFNDLNTEAEKGLDKSLMGQGEKASQTYREQKAQRLMTLIMQRNIPESAYLPAMAALRNPGAMMLTQKR
jgi:hypothetical protein